VLMPHPAILRRLVEEYEALVAEGPEEALTRTDGRAQELAYTLCVSTGTREIGRALETARRQLAEAYRADAVSTAVVSADGGEAVGVMVPG